MKKNPNLLEIIRANA
uniref:Uncharacterized protein n=1 Tax=Anguilla anguilla TaxID=7936 RepID=A0A0E9Q919_ANGAN